MKHAHHHMDQHSRRAYARLHKQPLRARLAATLSDGIPRTARELEILTGDPLVSVRSRLSVGCHASKEGPAIFREAVEVSEDGSRTEVYAYALTKMGKVLA